MILYADGVQVLQMNNQNSFATHSVWMKEQSLGCAFGAAFLDPPSLANGGEPRWGTRPRRSQTAGLKSCPDTKLSALSQG